MDLSSPISSVIPSSHGIVLTVLARTTEPLSGRKVAELADGRVSQKQANTVLGELTLSGVVLRESHPPAKLYRLNRDHVAATGIVALADLWSELMQRVREELASWDSPPLSASVFGSAARGEATARSDIDVLLIPQAVDHLPTEEEQITWDAQVDRLAERVHAWSGNPCEILELTLVELQETTKRRDRLARELKRDAIHVAGDDVRALMSR